MKDRVPVSQAQGCGDRLLTLRPTQTRHRTRVVPRVAWVLSAVVLCLSSVGVGAQREHDYSGLWVLDVDRTDARDVYGEIRLVHQSQREIRLTIVDYGGAWIEGAFRQVVAIRPWVFRIGSWGPRRGPPDSKQPRTIARWSGQEIVLAKSTFSGVGEFVWVWSVNADGAELVQRGTRRSWDSDFEKRPAEGQEIRFRLTSADEPAITSLGQRLARSGNVVTVPTEILVNVNTEATAVLVQCPKQDCTIADIENGARVRRRSLPREQVASIPTGLEVNIEPVP
jgi:hypothetical protein